MAIGKSAQKPKSKHEKELLPAPTGWLFPRGKDDFTRNPVGMMKMKYKKTFGRSKIKQLIAFIVFNYSTFTKLLICKMWYST